MIRIAILAPIGNSLYSRLVAHCAAAESGVEISAIVVRTPWSLSRLRSEFRRDGARLFAKVRSKLIVGEDRNVQSKHSIAALAQRLGLTARTLREFAVARGIAYREVSNHNEPSALDMLRKAGPDLIAFTGGGLLRRELLSIPRLGILNCHCGLLPEYRGMDVVEWPAAEDRFDAHSIGLTLHFMDTGVDTGPILLRRPLDLQPGDTFKTIRGRIQPAQVEMVLEGIRGIREGSINPEPQNLEAGRQYYVMHPRMLRFAQDNLDRHSKSGAVNYSLDRPTDFSRWMAR